MEYGIYLDGVLFDVYYDYTDACIMLSIMEEDTKVQCVIKEVLNESLDFIEEKQLPVLKIDYIEDII